MRVLLSALSLALFLSGIVGGVVLIRRKETQRAVLLLVGTSMAGLALLTLLRRHG